MDLVIRRNGNLIDLSPDGSAPLSEGLVRLLQPHLTYTYRESLAGQFVYNPITRKRVHVRVMTKYLFKLEEGRLVTSFGMLSRIRRVLNQAGHQLFWQDLTPAPARSDAYQTCWANVEQWIRFRHPRQRECLEAISRSECGVIDAPTAFGKSLLWAAVGLFYPKAKIDIVVKRLDVMHSLSRSLRRFLPSVGVVGDGRKDRGKRVTIYCISSIQHAEGDADFLLAEEVHELLGDNYATALSERYLRSRNFGSSASPDGRFDGGSARLEALFGPLIYRMTYQEAVSLGLVAPIRVHWVPVVMDVNPAAGKTDMARDRWGIWRNDYRNQTIAQAAGWFGPEEQVLIMVETIEHAIALRQFLPDFTLCYSKDDKRFDVWKRNGVLPRNFPPMTAERREALRLAFESGELKKVISTDVWAVGVDFVQLAVLIRGDGRPGNKILDTQLPGRTARIYDGKAYGLIVDFIDYFDESLRGRSRGRESNYVAKGWPTNWPQRNRRLETAVAPERADWQHSELGME